MKFVDELKSLSLIDKIVFFFLLLFLGSLTNSIFINQLGYYGALVTLLVKFFKEKKNPFSKTGLEYALLFFILAEVLSTVFSIEPAASFNNLLKRVLLLPIIYVLATSPNSIRQIKFYFGTYLSVALLSILIYLYFSAQFYLDNLYHVVQSGPSVFQYPITASEIMTFTAMFCFAFFINEKENWKVRAIAILLMTLSMLALFATYKRTGWIAAIAGILFMLIIKRKWLYLLPFVVAVIIFGVKDTEWSDVEIFQKKESGYSSSQFFNTSGKAYNVSIGGKDLFLSDYDEGIKIISNGKIVKHISTPSPVISSFEVDDFTLGVNLIDTRFLLINKVNGEIINEFQTTGFTHAYKYFNGKLYVLDLDSGLTIYPDIHSPENNLRYNTFHKYSTMDVDSNKLIIFSAEMGLRIFDLQNGLPVNGGVKIHDTQKYLPFHLLNKRLLTSDGNAVYLFEQNDSTLDLISKTEKIKRLTHFSFVGSEALLVDGSKEVYSLNVTSQKLDEAEPILTYKKQISSIKQSGDEIVITSFKQSRIKSIWDVHNMSNSSRFALWRGGIEIFKDYPLFGVGDIDLAKLYREYKRPFDKEIQGHMHNNYVHLLVILGAFGFLAVMFLLIKIFLIDLKIFNEVKTIPFLSSYSLGVLGGFVAFLTAGLTEWNFGDHEIITIVWFTLGLNLAVRKIKEVEIKE
ncbi:MAG: O-antigen ligase family protein [Ignavibacteria bacterium]|nr:O-antigen ligase family protein [Ignavibacteria bacterium]